MNAFVAAKGAFTTANDLELQSIDGLGFRPLAVVAWWARQSTSGAERGNRGGIGFWTAEESASVAWVSGDGEASARTGRLADTAALLGLGEAGAGVAMRASVESFDPDGLTLRYAERPSEQWVVHFLALGGNSLEGARVGWIPSPSRAGRVDLPLAETRPDLLLLVPAPAETGAVARDLTIGIGAASARGQAVAGYVCPHGAMPGAVTGAQRSDAAFIDWPGEASGANRLCYLAVDGLRCKVGTDVSPTGPGTTYTRVGFRPDALLLFSWGLSRSPLVKTIGRLCIGGASGDRSGCVSWDDRNVEARQTNTHVRCSAVHALVVTDTQTGGVHAQAALTSIDEHGFTLDWTNDGNYRQFAYVALSGRDTRGPARRFHDLISRVARTGKRL